MNELIYRTKINDEDPNEASKLIKEINKKAKKNQLLSVGNEDDSRMGF